MKKYMVAVVQMDTQNDKEQNWKQIAAYVDEAAAKGAKLVAFPEVVNILSEAVKRLREMSPLWNQELDYDGVMCRKHEDNCRMC